MEEGEAPLDAGAEAQGVRLEEVEEAVAVRHAGPVWALSCESAHAATAESAPGLIGHITLGAKRAGVRRAGNPHAAYDVAGAGNGTMERTEAPAEGESRRQQLPPIAYRYRASCRLYPLPQRTPIRQHNQAQGVLRVFKGA